MSGRFVVLHRDKLTNEQLEQCFCPIDECFWALVDTRDGRVLGVDYAEPEDKILLRDFSWVVNEMNALAAELEKPRAP